ncbi:hypothetical protein [Novosphingobium sediminicola]|uniref:Uncharacterized protein n=1 Tax=Novosphingobium sediminicola TaxID=563162 RepID=A0A7W6CEX8_9SPHN|nr:hypothetical protein [Novosphingobium sediminicola]MBB3955293.1 hypothetical protein [Novosphingobium sediminicola]
MTSQIPDTIYYQDRRCDLMATPLEAYFEQGPARPELDCSYSALWRGYIATWRLVEGRLFLVYLRPGMADGPKLTLGTVFPGQGRRVLASWFTGSLRISEGHCQEWLEGGFMNAHERETLVEIAEGWVISERTLDLASIPMAAWPAEVMGDGWA